MAFSGGLGVDLDLAAMPVEGTASDLAKAFAEDPSRYLLEIRPADLERLTAVFEDLPHAVVGRFRTDAQTVSLSTSGGELVSESLERFRTAWNEGCRR